jgi:hypothetical protein
MEKTGISMESFTHWYAYQKRLILGEKGVQMCGIEYYPDILKMIPVFDKNFDISCAGVMI